MADSSVPIPSDVFQNKDWDSYEKHVDSFIGQNKLEPGATFKVDHPDGPHFYKYNGPNSGGRKDWQEVDPAPSNLVSKLRIGNKVYG